MSFSNAPAWCFALSSVLVLASGCSAGTRELPAAPQSAAPTASVTAPAIAERPPPPVVTEAMPGEPSSTALTKTRLVSASCKDSSALAKRRADALVKKMRQEVDAEYRSWRAYQPTCWQELRSSSGIRAFGAAGLGLSGVGEGGGGYGEGVGLDSGRLYAPTAKRASGTNNQIHGVDEADIVKNDGRYVYVVANGALRIVEALNPRVLSITRFKGTVRKLFVEKDRALVYVSEDGNGTPSCSYGYDCVFAGDGSSTRLIVLDISNRSAPRVRRNIKLSGSLISARRIGNAVHTVVSDGDAEPPDYLTWPDEINWCGTPAATVRAKVHALEVRNEKQIRASMKATFPTLEESGEERALCENLLKTPIRDGNAFTTIVSLDLASDAPPTTATIQSRPGAVFASADALFVAVVHQQADAHGASFGFYPDVNEVSDVHKFHIGADPRDTRYVASGVVPGHVLNQFAMDEWYGYLRLATTRGRVPDPKVESVVSVLAEKDGSLVRVGAIDKLAPGEDIRAVRFDGDRGYVVTFKKTDPLFVLDLYQPTRPVVLGELKIPGFSTYMHRLDPNHLLSIGFDANDHGDFAYFDGLLLQLFDVTHPTEPKLLHREKIGTRGSSSEGATDHLAFNYFADAGLLAIPTTQCGGGGDGINGDKVEFSGLDVYRVDVARGFERVGRIDHGKHGADCNSWWSNATSAVKRSLFLDDLVYSVATDRIKVQRLSRLGKDVADLALTP